MRKLAAFLPAFSFTAAFCLTLATAQAAPATEITFNGKDFTGWKVIGCEAEVQNGEIFLKAGNGLIQAEEQFADFVMEIEWKALKSDKWDSGIYFRYTTIPPKRPWPARHQANLRQGLEGNVSDLPGATSTGLTKPGEWNHFKLTVIGTTAALEINGKPAWKADGLIEPKGFVSIQAEVPGGGQFLFRNIRIKSLDKPATP